MLKTSYICKLNLKLFIADGMFCVSVVREIYVVISCKQV